MHYLRLVSFFLSWHQIVSWRSKSPSLQVSSIYKHFIDLLSSYPGTFGRQLNTRNRFDEVAIGYRRARDSLRMPWAPNSPLTAGAATLVLHPHPSPSLSPLPLTLRQAHYLRQNPFRARRHAFLNCHHQTRSFGIRSIDPPRITRYNSGPESPTLLSSPKAALQRRLEADTLPLRTGALAIKKGMTSMFDLDSGARIPCTVLQMDRVQVVAHKTRRRHGYHAVCVGHGWRRAKNISKPMLGHYSSQGVPPKAELREFRVRDHRGLLAVGTEINADWFITGQFVDTRSHCKGKGFQGVMKRWGMHGQDRSHGASLSHRSLGSAGQGQGGGSRVYPGKKMAGNMGGQRNTVQSLKVMQVDANSGVVVVHGMDDIPFHPTLL